MWSLRSCGDRCIRHPPRTPTTSHPPLQFKEKSEFESYQALNIEVAGQSGAIGFKGATLGYRKIGEVCGGAGRRVWRGGGAGSPWRGLRPARERYGVCVTVFAVCMCTCVQPLQCHLNAPHFLP